MDPLDEQFLRDERDEKRRESRHEVMPWLAENEGDGGASLRHDPPARDGAPPLVWEHEQAATD